MESIDFDETFALLARLKSIRILLAIASHLNFKLYQMDVKSVFLNGILQEEVYVEQPKGFVDPHRPYDVYKLLGHMCFTCLEHMSRFYVIGLSFDKTHFTCIWVDLGCFKYFKISCFKIKY